MFKRITSVLLLVLVMLPMFALVACNKDEGGDRNFVDPSEWEDEGNGDNSSGGDTGDDEGIRGDAADSSGIELPKVDFN